MNLKKLLCILLMISAMLILAACGEKCDSHVDKDDNGLCDNCGESFDDGDEKEEHTHDYSNKVVSDEYLATPATCENAAKYYYSCSCGEKSTSTFTNGDPLEHTFDKKVATDEYLAAAADCKSAAVYYHSCICGATGTTTFTSGDPLEHTFDKEVVADEYFAAAASCKSAATYYHSCICGATGTTTFTSGNPLVHRDIDDNALCDNCGESFEDGKDVEEHVHTYDQKAIDNAYLASAATCKNAATYYYSCSCGVKGTTTFESGEPRKHTFNQNVVSDKYLATEAGCESSATYYYSCSCGEKGTATFKNGEPLGHKDTDQNSLCDRCNEHVHNYIQETVSDKYLASGADCKNAATYYHSCICGETGTTTFTSGDPLEHKDSNEDQTCDICDQYVPSEDDDVLESPKHEF